MDDQQQFLKVRLDAQADRKRFAEGMLDKIDNEGWTFHEARGNEDLRDVTAERREHYAAEVVQADELSAAYTRWYGEPSA